MITLATAADLPRILALYAHARAFMAQNGNPNQWGQTRPTEADIAAAAKAMADKIPEIAGIRHSTKYKQPVAEKLAERVLRRLLLGED